MKYFDYLINGKFESFTHPKEGLTPLKGITPEIRRFPKLEGGKVVLDVEAKDAYDFKVFNDALKNKKEENKLLFEDAKENYSGFIEIESVKWNSGEKYLKNCNVALSEIEKGTIEAPINWRDYDNNFHQLTSLELTQLRDDIETDIFLKGQELYFQKWDYENQIAACTTIQEIENITINYKY